jgi:hypothetical protein
VSTNCHLDCLHSRFPAYHLPSIHVETRRDKEVQVWPRYIVLRSVSVVRYSDSKMSSACVFSSVFCSDVQLLLALWTGHELNMQCAVCVVQIR